MMYLINENFKVIGKGDHLKANDGNFILHSSLTVATLLEVAKTNKVKLNDKSNAVNIAKQLENHFNQLQDLKQMSEQNTEIKVDQKYIDIIQNGFENNLDSDAIQVELVKAGLKFKAAASTFKKVSEALGLKVSAKDRFEKAKELLGDFIPTNWESVQKAASHIVKGVPDTNDAQAVAILRKICKDAEKEFPKKPKGAKAGNGPRGFKATAYQWILDNKDATKADLEKFLSENEQRPVFVSHYWDIMQICRNYAS